MAANEIELLAARLQSLPPGVRWLAAQQEIIRATAERRPPVRGRWGRWADRIVGLSGRFARPLVAAVNIVLVAATYVRQMLGPRAGEMRPAAIFVGIRALREPELVRRFEARQGRSVLYLDERTLADFFGHGRVPFSVLLTEMSRIWCDAWEHLGPNVPSTGVPRRYLLSHLLLHGHRFAYLRAWFQGHLSRPDCPRQIACSAASYVAFAAVAAGARTVYMLHGFQRRSLVYPDFDEAECFTAIEARHITNRLPRMRTTVLAEPTTVIVPQRAVAVVPPYSACQDLDVATLFVRWALGRGLDIVVRGHPDDESSLWGGWAMRDGVEVDDTRAGIDAFLLARRPLLLATWTSTTLFDALRFGVLPVTFLDDPSEAADHVIPLYEMALRFPAETETIETAIDKPKLRLAMARERLERIMGQAAARSECAA